LKKLFRNVSKKIRKIAFRFDHVFTSLQQFNVLVEIIKFSLFWAVFGGLVYCALEPYVRRWWSEYLISWSRLLAVDFRNPMIGRDVLIGGALACSTLLVSFLGESINVFGFGHKEISTDWLIGLRLIVFQLGCLQWLSN
jgi:hypothetical protein